MFDILGWIVFGLLVGIVAKFLMPGKDGGGFIVTTLLGICGAVVGGYLGQALGLYESGAAVGFIMATIGAMILLWGHRAMTRK